MVFTARYELNVEIQCRLKSVFIGSVNTHAVYCFA
jgi:hypothetical protein